MSLATTQLALALSEDFFSNAGQGRLNLVLVAALFNIENETLTVITLT